MLSPEHMEILSDPSFSLRAFGHVMGQEYDDPIRYDPFAITDHLQETILGYASSPPVHDDVTQWLVVLKYRQGGSSTTGCLAFYVKAQFNPGWEHITLADHKERADYLFERVMFNHARWPEAHRAEQVSQQETRQLTWTHGGKMRVLSGRTAGAGIGRSASSLLASELPLWPDAGGQFNYIFPSMVNRRRAQMLLESTPFPMNEPSAEWYKNLCDSASRGRGRFKYAFFPFWDGKLNWRPWPEGSPLTIEEQRLMDKYAHLGMTVENLSFRRYTMDLDPIISANPELFFVFYPPDDIVCWQQSSKAVIRWEHISHAVKDELTPWGPSDEYVEYAIPRHDANYVIGVDPSGHGTRDHASFQVLEVWDRDWRQVAAYASHAEPDDVARKLFDVGRRYGWASICVERNGVGTAITTALRLLGYPNIWVDRHQRPGLHKQSEEGMVSDLIDALRHCLDLRDRDTVSQLKSYQGDRAIQPSTKQVLLDRANPGRRGRHHWDKVSALMVAVVAARTMPQRSAPAPAPGVVVPMPGLTLDDIERMAKAQRRPRKTKDSGRRARYRRRRRRG